MRITQGEEKKKGKEEIFKIIMTENFPRSMSDAKLQIQEAQRIPRQIKEKKTLPLGISYSKY